MIKNDEFRKYYDLDKKIGDGKYGSVYKARNKYTGEQRAIKIIDKNRIKFIIKKENIRDPTDDEINQFLNRFFKEIENMKIIQGKNKENNNAIIFYECYLTNEELAIVMELCDNNLLNFFSKKTETFNPEDIYLLLNHINNSFKIMEENKIFHNAINLENILIKYENQEHSKYIYKLKISSRSCPIKEFSQKNIYTFRQGRAKFTAPEILRGNDYIEKSDLWSLGVLIYILFFRKYPNIGKNEKLESTKNDNLDDLINKLLIEDPKERLSWKDYFNHPFLIRSSGDFRNYYDIINKIGDGGFSKVYKVNLKGTNINRAIKVINKDSIKEEFKSQHIREISNEEMKTYVNEFINEIKNMELAEGKNKDNENTVKFYEYFNNEKEMAIVMELCDENLTSLLVKKKFTVKEIYEVLSQLNNTFKIMDECIIAHRDLKLENILVKYINAGKVKYVFKLTDFGSSIQLITLSKKMKTMAGTLNFMAPEILEGKEYNNECDLWSLGIIIYLLFFKKHPYEDKNEFGILKKIKDKGNKNLEKTNDKDLDDLISKLLTENPKKRINWKQYFNHPFFKKFN